MWMEDGQLNNWKIGVADMVSNFVPGSGNPLGFEDKKWNSLSKLEQLSKVFESISKSGFEYVELAAFWVNNLHAEFSCEDVKYLLSKYDIKINSFCSFVPAHIKLVGKECNVDDVENYVQTTLKNCNELGGNIMVFGSADARFCPDGYDRQKAKKDIIRFLKLTNNIIDKNNYKLKIAIEPLNKKESNTINTLLEAKEIVDLVGSKNVGLLIDTYHANLQENDFFDDLESIKESLIHVHLAQPETRKYPCSLQGDGCFDFGRLFDKLQEISYSGNFTVECNFDNMNIEASKCFSLLDKLRHRYV